ncbi:MAG: alanine dehydrogenase, partial [Thermomicrobiales bacterium]|nr:alanine dehydrogenase [Thermomicrobiales bacterium]
MLVGVPTEVKDHEFRVALTPANAHEYVARGNQVLIQAGAGTGSGFTDAEYIEAGAEIAPDARRVFAAADMILKVKEPVEAEYDLLRPGQILFT